MKRILISTLLAALPLTAQAGFGSTYYFTNEYAEAYTSPAHYLPSLDFKQEGLVIQIALLETVASLTREDDIFFGINGYQTVTRRNLTREEINGVVQLGLSLDYDAVIEDVNALTVLGSMRLGAQTQGGMGVGVYVVPEIGFNTLTGDDDAAEFIREDATELAVGGQLQVSVWMAR